MLLECSTKVAAPARTVFGCVDNPEQIVRWVGGIVEHAYITERSPSTAVGQKFRQQLKQGRSIRTFHGEIIAWEPHTHFGLRIPTDAYSSEAHFRITPTGPDSSSVDYAIDVDLHSGLAKFLGPLLRFPLSMFVRHQIGRLKECAETAHATREARA